MTTQNTIPEGSPIDLFTAWLALAKQSEPSYAEACALATVSPAGQPHVRMVLLRDSGPKGFIFYTNMTSTKGKDLSHNPKASLMFHWKSLGKQIRIEGTCAAVAPEVSDAYFANRPRGSQLASIASHQSAPLSARADYENAHKALEAEYADGRPIPRPSHWQGMRLSPDRIEFWEDRPYRMHHRYDFLCKEAGGEGAGEGAGQWQSQLLYP